MTSTKAVGVVLSAERLALSSSDMTDMMQGRQTTKMRLSRGPARGRRGDNINGSRRGHFRSALNTLLGRHDDIAKGQG